MGTTAANKSLKTKSGGSTTWNRDTIWQAVVLVSAGVLFFLSVVAEATEPRFRNKSASYRPLTPSQEKHLAPTRLGGTPQLDGTQWKTLRGGQVLGRIIPCPDDSRCYEAMGIVDAPRKDVMALLKDYTARLEITPNLEQSSVEWEGNLARVEQTFRYGLTRVSLRINALHYGNSVIEWEYVEGDFRDIGGSTRLHAIDHGQRTLIVQRLRTDPGVAVPDFIMDRITKKSMTDEICAIQDNLTDRARKIGENDV